jgi:putative transposase
MSMIVANSSTGFINGNKMCNGKFCWQQSASAFSVSKKDVDRICKYILTQEEHHKIRSFQQEYDEFIQYYQKTLKPKVIRLMVLDTNDHWLLRFIV